MPILLEELRAWLTVKLGYISFSGDFAASVVTCCNQLAMRCDSNVFGQTLDSLLSSTPQPCGVPWSMHPKMENICQFL